MTGDKKESVQEKLSGEFIHGNAIRMKKIGVLLNNNDIGVKSLSIAP